jgi:hypothetical protein
MQELKPDLSGKRGKFGRLGACFKIRAQMSKFGQDDVPALQAGGVVFISGFLGLRFASAQAFTFRAFGPTEQLQPNT